MVERPKEPAENIVSDIKRTERELLDACGNYLTGVGVYFQHFYLMGVARRTLAQSHAFRQLVEDRNHLVLFAIIRMQLDTALRLYALYWVEKPEEFARQVYMGGQVNRLKAADGQQMSDKYLKDKLSHRYPWIDDVYQNTSGAIHFSNRHILAAIRTKEGGERGEFEMLIGPNDRDHELEDYHELLAAFRHINMIINVAVEDAFDRLQRVGTIAG